MSSKYQGSVLSSLIDVSNDTGTKKRVAIVVTHPPTVASPSSSDEVISRDLRDRNSPRPFLFLFFLFWRSELDYDIQT